MSSFLLPVFGDDEIKLNSLDQRKTFNVLVKELLASPWGSSINYTEIVTRKRIIEIALKLTLPPAIPEEARRSMAEGKAAFRIARNVSGFKEVDKHFRKAANYAAWWPDAYYNRAIVLEELHEYKYAKENLEFYLLASPTASDVAAVKDKIYELEYLNKRKQEAETYHDAGTDYYNEGNYHEAVSSYKKAIEIDPNIGLVHANLGVAYGRLEKDKEALVELKEGIRLGVKKAYVYAEIGRAYRNLDQRKQAIAIMEKGVNELSEWEKYGDDSYGFLRKKLGLYYEQEGDYEKSLVNFEAALEFGKKDVDKKWVQEIIDKLKRRLGR
jgi:tetratricopeptide (TPR) repeat protein